MESVERFICVVGALEDVIFQKRMRLLQRDKNRRARDRQACLKHLSISVDHATYNLLPGSGLAHHA